MKKKFVMMVTSLTVCAFLLVGCAGKTPEGEAPEGETVEEAVEEVIEEAVEEVAEEVTEEEESEAAEETEEATEEPKEEFVADRSEVFAMFADMSSGWNLGNSLDAHGAGNSNSAETNWGNPKTTKEMIDAVVDKGFNVIRIPITWGEHVSAAPEYAINPDWMDRVEEVVNYAMDRDVYVIIDTHHEENYWMSTETDPAHADAVKAELVAIWEQVSERFKDYNEKLIFEGMNEPRLVGSAAEWNGGTPEERVLINEWNQAFVDTVRASGGNNETRCLIICPYGTSANMKAIKELEIPEDNHIAVAVHMYTPYEFTYIQENKGADVSVWDGSAKATIANSVKYLKQTLIDKEVPVIITEYGAQNKDNREDINNWVTDYLGYMTKAGIPCIWWDNGTYNTAGEKFAIFNRHDCTWYAESTADTIIKVTSEKGEE